MFIELHRVVNYTPSAMTAEPIMVNKRYIRNVYNCKTFDADWDIARTRVQLPNESMTVTETYEEVKEMLLG